ncbi:uncharacterized protein LOC102396469 isoform X2 [Bubalus bubalis]|uniref:uncharacterized protein LOC102396469 isoform X2 n=1 Tax=Bubalus bubalis TaxID=89462 RepID=UPI000DBCB291|nr:uncharacterized protein LOC102396469 isoform X2 [Bubalus bubalis]
MASSIACSHSSQRGTSNHPSSVFSSPLPPPPLPAPFFLPATSPIPLLHPALSRGSRPGRADAGAQRPDGRPRRHDGAQGAAFGFVPGLVGLGRLFQCSVWSTFRIQYTKLPSVYITRMSPGLQPRVWK